MKRASLVLFAGALALALIGCSGAPGDDPSEGAAGAGSTGGGAAPATHTGHVSIQELSVLGVPEAGGLTIRPLFTERRAPIFEETPGSPVGCKIWIYDVHDDPAPGPTDQGLLTVEGLEGGPRVCGFEPESGYVCPTAARLGTASDAPKGDALAPGVTVSVTLESGGLREFHFAPTAPVTPGEAFELDDASAARITALPLDGTPVSFGCSGDGGSCGDAPVTVLRISTTDGDVTGLSPIEMPPALDKHVEIQCAEVDTDGTIVVPAPVMGLLALVHADAPATRIRTEYRRNGLAIGVNAPPEPLNPTYVGVGHAIVGFSSPEAGPGER